MTHAEVVIALTVFALFILPPKSNQLVHQMLGPENQIQPQCRRDVKGQSSTLQSSWSGCEYRPPGAGFWHSGHTSTFAIEISRPRSLPSNRRDTVVLRYSVLQ